MGSRHVVSTIQAIPPGSHKIVEIEGRSIGVFNIRGEFFALRNRCPHQGGALCSGRLTGFPTARVPGEYQYTRKGEILRCPWHGWEYDVKTGKSWVDPKRVRTRSYPVEVESGADIQDRASPDDTEQAPEGLVQGPYFAEIYPVSVEQQYIVVELP